MGVIASLATGALAWMVAGITIGVFAGVLLRLIVLEIKDGRD